MRWGRTTLALAAASLTVVGIAQTTPLLVKDFASNTVADRLYPPRDAAEIAPGRFVYADFSRADPGGIWTWDSTGSTAPQLISAHRVPSGAAFPLPAAVQLSGSAYPFAVQNSSNSNHGVAFGGAYWYSAFGGASQGFELYRSNGTVTGSTLFKDLWLGSGNGAPHSFVVDGGQMYFAANGIDPISARPAAQLYKSDGTSVGTQAFASFVVNGPSEGVSLGFKTSTNDLVVAGGRVYASVEQTIDTRYNSSFINLFNVPARPVRSDLGKTTAEVIQFEGSDIFLDSRITAGTDGNAYFCGSNGSAGLYIDTGTVTSRVGLNSGSRCSGVLAAGASGAYFFATMDGVPGLYRALNGSITAIATHLDAATTGVAFGSEVFFIATGSQPGLVALDLGGATLRTVASFDPLANPGSAQYGTNILTLRNGALWYSVRAPNANPGLYRLTSNNASPSLQSSDVTQYAGLVGVQAQAAPYPRPQTGQRGSLISNTAPRRPTATGRALQPLFNGEVAGAAQDASAGGQRVTFISDSTEAGTRTIEIGSPLAATLAVPGGFMAAYRGNDGTNRLDYVARDGVTSNVFTTNFSNASGRQDDTDEVTALHQAGGQVYFIASGAAESDAFGVVDALWAWSNGSAPRAIATPVSPLTPPMPLGQGMVYVCHDADSTISLCQTDGATQQILLPLMQGNFRTPTPFIQLGTPFPSPADIPNPDYFAQFLGYANGKLVLEFQKLGFNTPNNRQLIATDGTPQGTVVLVDQAPFTSVDDYPNAIGCPQDCAYLPGTAGVSVGGTLVFGFGDADEGQELWQTDGTAAGTSRLMALRSGPAGGSPFAFTAASNLAYFVADNGNGGEIWRTDGTVAGTVQVTDFVPGPMGSDPTQLVWSPDLQALHFAANRSDIGRELFSVDSAGQVTLTSEFNAGPQSGRVLNMVRAGRSLVLSANDGNTGEELYAVPVAANGLEQPRVFAMAASVIENTEAGSMTMRVVMDPPATQTVTVDYATGDGTASAGVDYTSAQGTLTFAAGETEKLVSVAVINDEDDEADETLLLTLRNAVGAGIGNPTAVGVLQNDDRKIQDGFAFTTDNKSSTLHISAGNIRNFSWQAPPAGSPEGDFQHGFLFLEVDKLLPGETVEVTVTINVADPFGGPGSGGGFPCPTDPNFPPPPGGCTPTGGGTGGGGGSSYTPPESMVKCLPAGCAVYPAQLSNHGGQQIISFTLVDGGSGDADGLPNREIIDPIGPLFPTMLEPFSVAQRNNVAINRYVTSERVTVAGGSGACADISGDNGLQFSIDSAPFVDGPARLCAGNTISVRHISSAAASTSKTSTLFVGNLFTVAFTTVTTAADRTPEAFSFASQTGVKAGALVNSNAVTPVGYNTATAVSPGPGVSFSINGGAFKTSGNIAPGQSLVIRHNANNQKGGYTKSYVRIGDTTAYFTTRTQ